MIRRLLLSLALAASASAATPDATSVGADHQEISMRTGETILTGHPHIDYGNLRLTADELRYNPKSRTVVASGHAILTEGPRRLLADKIAYHSADGTYEVDDVRMGEFPIYISGASATGDRRGVTISDARVSIPEPGALIPSLHAARLFFSSDRKIHADSASVGLGSIRPLALHGLDHDVQHPVIPYATLTGGYRRSLGVFALAGLHLPLNEFFRLGGDIGVYSARGLMAGPSGAYSGTAGDNTFDGLFRSGFIHDYGTRYTDILGRAVPPNRGFVEWQHQQQIGERITLSGELNYWRDSEVLRDFRPSEFFRVQQPDTFLESVYAGDNTFISLFARFQPNSFETVQQRLPELRFDLLPLAVGDGFYERFSASVAVLRQDSLPASPLNSVAPTPHLESNRFDAYYGLSRPITPTEWFAFTPVAGGRLTHYADLSGPRSNYTRALGEVGFDAELRTSAVYDYKNPQWKIDGLRHLFTPKLSYRYIPEAEKGARYIPPIDRQSFSTYLQPLGLGDIRNLDDLHATNTLRLGFDNTLQTRDPVYGSRDLVTLNLANDFFFNRPNGHRNLSEIHVDLAIVPARWLELGVYQSFAPQDFTMSEFNTGLTLRDGDDWTLRFASNLLRGDLAGHEPLNDYYLQATKRLNEVYEAVAHLRYDARARRFDEQSYGVRQNLGNVWSLEYVVTIYNGPRRESRFGFSVRVGAFRF